MKYATLVLFALVIASCTTTAKVPVETAQPATPGTPATPTAQVRPELRRKVIPIAHASPDVLLSLLFPLRLAPTVVSINRETRELVIEGLAEDVEHVATVAAFLDQDERQARIVWHRQLKHADASKLARRLTVTMSRGRTGQDPFLFADVDAKTNTLILVGTQARIEEALKELDALDAPVVTVERQVHNVSSSDAARLINAMFSPESTPVAPDPRRIHADSDAKTNSVILHGIPREVDQAVDMLNRIEAMDLTK